MFGQEVGHLDAARPAEIWNNKNNVADFKVLQLLTADRLLSPPRYL